MNQVHCFRRAIILIVRLISQKLSHLNKCEINICIKMFGDAEEKPVTVINRLFLPT